MNPRTLRRLHLYLGAIFAPTLLALTVSGAWQIYRWNDARKDGSYTPPRVVKLMSSIHKNQTTTGKETPQKTGIKAFAFLAAILLITTTLLGIVMAYRFTPSPVAVTLCLLSGIVVPILLLALANP
jgi:hypothetical protein